MLSCSNHKESAHRQEDAIVVGSQQLMQVHCPLLERKMIVIVELIVEINVLFFMWRLPLAWLAVVPVICLDSPFGFYLREGADTPCSKTMGKARGNSLCNSRILWSTTIKRRTATGGGR